MLLDALNQGRGTAKMFDAGQSKYLVRWDQLGRFLRRLHAAALQTGFDQVLGAITAFPQAVFETITGALDG